MTKSELKDFMLIYHKILDSLDLSQSTISIRHCGRKKVIKIEPWMLEIRDLIRETIEAEDDFVFSEIVGQKYINGKNDAAIFTSLPITESTYYRTKKYFEEKLYELLIAAGHVTKDEILANKIIK